MLNMGGGGRGGCNGCASHRQARPPHGAGIAGLTGRLRGLKPGDARAHRRRVLDPQRRTRPDGYVDCYFFNRCSRVELATGLYGDRRRCRSTDAGQRRRPVGSGLVIAVRIRDAGPGHERRTGAPDVGDGVELGIRDRQAALEEAVDASTQTEARVEERRAGKGKREHDGGGTNEPGSARRSVSAPPRRSRWGVARLRRRRRKAAMKPHSQALAGTEPFPIRAPSQPRRARR